MAPTVLKVVWNKSWTHSQWQYWAFWRIRWPEFRSLFCHSRAGNACERTADYGLLLSIRIKRACHWLTFHTVRQRGKTTQAKKCLYPVLSQRETATSPLDWHRSQLEDPNVLLGLSTYLIQPEGGTINSKLPSWPIRSILQCLMLDKQYSLIADMLLSYPRH